MNELLIETLEERRTKEKKALLEPRSSSISRGEALDPHLETA